MLAQWRLHSRRAASVGAAHSGQRARVQACTRAGTKIGTFCTSRPSVLCRRHAIRLVASGEPSLSELAARALGLKLGLEVRGGSATSAETYRRVPTSGKPTAAAPSAAAAAAAAAACRQPSGVGSLAPSQCTAGMSAASRVQSFLEEAGAKRAAPPAAQAAEGGTLLLPITLQLDHGHKGSDAPREVCAADCYWKLDCSL